MESFLKNRKLLENRWGGKFTELGNFGMFLLGSVAKRQLVPKHRKILLFFFPFLGICWTVMGKKCHRKAKATLIIYCLLSLGNLKMTFLSPLLSVIRKNNTDTFDYSYLLNVSKFMHLKVYSWNYILNFRDAFNYFFVASGWGFPIVLQQFQG